MSDDRFLIRISEEIPTLQECFEFCSSDPSAGAVSTFVGITRDTFEGKRVLKLSYEGYVTMAEKELLQLCNEAVEKYASVKRIAAVHILGDCPISNASVILACSSPHRRDAIHCCEFLIDELKARIPIWKRKVDENGGVLKENVEWMDSKSQRVIKRAEL